MIGIYNIVLILAVLVFMLKKRQYKVVTVLVVSLIYAILISFTSYMSLLSYKINILIFIFLGISLFLAGIFEKEK
ncbi:Uncharacterized protein BWAI21_01488 [Bacillus mycoides]|nr:Uncharacterized protein BWAI21_01488 [Bacillus mycoides]